MADSGYLRVEGTNLCYTDGFSNKYTISHDTGYSSVVGVDKKGYFWIDENDLLRIYYIDENGVKRRTDVAESLGNVGSDSKGYIWVGNDSYLYFIGPTGGKMRINGTVTPIVSNEYLYFESVSTCDITLTFGGNNPPASLEISYDKNTWSDYTLGNTITLQNAGDRVYWRNKSAVQTAFTEYIYDAEEDYGYYRNYSFSVLGYVYAGGDANYLLCKNSTTDLTDSGDYCFRNLFSGCIDLLSAPQLPATTLTANCYANMFFFTGISVAPQLPAMVMKERCYNSMFMRCPNLTTPPALPATTLDYSCYANMFNTYGFGGGITSLPALPATTIPGGAYYEMFKQCTNIKMSETQTGEYQNPYRIPSSGTGTVGFDAMYNMFGGTSGTFAGTPNINQTYYTSNTIIS